MKTLILILLALTATAADLTETIKSAEGFSLTMYRDHLGYPTIGWGHRCSADQPAITKEQAEKILAEDIDAARKNTETLVGKDAPQDVKDIVAEMTFQLGFAGVSKFKGMLKCIRAKDYKGASVQMLDSKWAIQTPKRARRLALDMAAVKVEK